MTCVIATSDCVFADELKALAVLLGITVVSGGADLLLLDMDTAVTVPVCQRTLRFSRSTEAGADFVRPFSYRDLLRVLQIEYSEFGSDGSAGRTYISSQAFTATEKRLLDALMSADGKTVSSGKLAEKVFGNAECQNELKVYIRHLRQKIEEPQGIRVIETVRGEGYRFRSDRVLKVQFTDYTEEGGNGQ